MKQIYFTSGRAQWVETCAAVCSLTSLEKFTLVLDGGWFAENVSRIPVFLEPLRDVVIKSRSRKSRRRIADTEEEDGDGEGAYWEVILPKQPYYVNEVGRLNAEVRKRGLGCVFRV